MSDVSCDFHVTVKQVFKDMEFLGWYTTGGPPDTSDIHIHKQVGTFEWGNDAPSGLTCCDLDCIFLLCQVCEIIESPLFLKLNPMTKHTDVSCFLVRQFGWFAILFYVFIYDQSK